MRRLCWTISFRTTVNLLRLRVPLMRLLAVTAEAVMAVTQWWDLAIWDVIEHIEAKGMRTARVGRRTIWILAWAAIPSMALHRLGYRWDYYAREWLWENGFDEW